ncbi:MAG: hypothetical protein ACK5MF_04050 [Vibrio sp.]|uniref:hypothetical protein n=1 Tax=Vibrio sp. TaxID=678 RepID=UPI003A841F85
MIENSKLTEVKKANMVEEINHINENFKAALELGGQALEYLERKDKESNAMNLEIQTKEIEASTSKHKRVIGLIVYAVSLMVALCVIAFITGNAEYIKDILSAVALVMGGASIPKLLKTE